MEKLFNSIVLAGTLLTGVSFSATPNETTQTN